MNGHQGNSDLQAQLGDFEIADCGEVELKGIHEPMKLYAPRLREAAPPATGEEPLAVPQTQSSWMML